MHLTCGQCIQDQCVEGKWDRFGTTAEQELEALCEKHLLSHHKFVKEYSDAYSGGELYLAKVVEEIKKRGLLV